jgi:hypothetical protein
MDLDVTTAKSMCQNIEIYGCNLVLFELLPKILVIVSVY